MFHCAGIPCAGSFQSTSSGIMNSRLTATWKERLRRKFMKIWLLPIQNPVLNHVRTGHAGVRMRRLRQRSRVEKDQGRSSHRVFRGRLGVHTCYSLPTCRRPYAAFCLPGFDYFVTSIAAGIATRLGRPLPGQDFHLLEQRAFARHTWTITASVNFMSSNSHFR